MKALLDGGEEGVTIVIKSIPMLMLALFLVKILSKLKVIQFIEKLLNPVLSKIGVSGAVVLPIVTKFLAGGTAMMSVCIEMINEKKMTILELNKIAGLIIHPLDFVGVAFMATAGKRVASVIGPAVLGAVVGILFRAVLHFIIF